MPGKPEARNRWSRLASMSWDELRTRSAQEFCKRWDAARYNLGIRFGAARAHAKAQREAKFFFQPAEVPRILDELRRRQPAQVQEILRRAECLCEHKFDLLGYEGLDYGREIDWHLDRASGKRAPRKPWHKIRYLDFNEVGDSKVTWELNRHQHLVTLAKAYRLSGEQRFADELLRQWRHWQLENPYPLGINWASSLEVGFRSVSWLWVRALLAGTAVETEESSAELLGGLELHGRHIERYLSTYFSPNTHLLGEAVALFFLGTLCPELPAAERWQKQGWRIVLEESRRQVLPDGFHFEQSTYYHVYALDFFLHARCLAAANEIPVPAELDQTIERMLSVLACLGQVAAPPRFGDDDGGRVFDPRRNRAEHLLDPLSTGTVIYRRGDFKAIAGALREETIWLLGPRAAEEFDALPSARTAPESASLASCGIHVLADAEPGPQQIEFDAGPMGALSAGHGHADALSLRFAYAGCEILIDPGTFVYASAGADRDAFRTTAAHNTLVVDDMSQAAPAGPFAWGARVDALLDSQFKGKTFELVSAHHNAFAGGSNGVVHRRTLFHPRGSFWLIRDCVEGIGEHELELFWHLAPGLVPQPVGDAGYVLELGSGRSVALLTASVGSWEARTEQGWWSPVYGRKEAAPLFRLRIRACVPAEIVTLLQAMPAHSSNVGRLELLTSGDPSPISAYRYSIAGRTHWLFFAPTTASWSHEGWASDAEFLYCATADSAEVEHLALCNGSYVRQEGVSLFEANRRVRWSEWRVAAGEVIRACSEEEIVGSWPNASGVAGWNPSRRQS